MEPKTIEEELAEVRRIAGVLTYEKAQEYARMLGRIERYVKQWVSENYPFCVYQEWRYESDIDICITYKDHGDMDSSIISLVELFRYGLCNAWIC